MCDGYNRSHLYRGDCFNDLPSNSRCSAEKPRTTNAAEYICATLCPYGDVYQYITINEPATTSSPAPSSQKSQKPVDVTQEVNYFSFDVMADLTFSRSFNMLTTGEMNDVMRIVHRAQRLLGIFSHIPWIYNIIARVPGFISKQFAAVTNRMILERRKVC